MKYAFIRQHTAVFSIVAMCRVLDATRSGYYKWLWRQQNPSPAALRRQRLDGLVEGLFIGSKGRSGSPMITLDLADAGERFNRKTVAKSMKRLNLQAKAARKFKPAGSKRHNLPVADNHLQREFMANQPNQKWVGDITYLWSDEGWLYLAAVIDLYSRMVVGWAMSDRMTTPLVSDALEMALWRRKKPTGVLFHSDQGSQYCSNDYQLLLKRYQLVCSMSGKGNCYDNAVAESFFHTLKVELIHGERFTSREQLRRAVFEYIEVDYNRNRRHSALGYISPAAFEAKQVA